MGSMAERLVTVFGGSGFIGRYVVKRLAASGARVRVAVRRVENAKFLKPMGDVGQIAPFLANVRVESSVRAAVEGADAVVNLVGILHERGAQSFGAVQATAPGLIAAAAKASGVRRLVHLSAIGADPASPAAYARTKAEGEAAVRAEFPEATILRPSIVFGPEDGFFNRFGNLARLLPALPLIGGGETRFQPVYVGDVANAVMAALDRPDALGRTYELGGPRVYTFAELLQYVLEVTQRRRLLAPVPWPLAKLQGRVLGLLPNPPLTYDQVLLLEKDNVVGPNVPGLADLGIAHLHTVEAIVPTYLVRYRRTGQFATQES
jgi:NADH dehydrogenase